MEYREDRKGQRLSILGYGCMRFTKNGSAVDLDKAEQELMYAIRHGVNYLDTAYVYAGNEEAVGDNSGAESLQKGHFSGDEASALSH